MPHINRQPGGHDITASAYIVRLDQGEPKIMLHLHKKLNVYMQFGGHVEPTENPWQTIVHELREETGFDIEQLKVLQPPHRITTLPDTNTGLSNLHPTPLSMVTHVFDDKNDLELVDHHHSDIAFAFVANEPPLNEPEDGESNDLALFTLAELKQLEQTLPDVRAISTFVIEEVVPNWEAIPADSFTA